MKNPFFTIFGNYDVINELCHQNEVTRQTSLNSNDYKTPWCEIASSFNDNWTWIRDFRGDNRAPPTSLALSNAESSDFLI